MKKSLGLLIVISLNLFSSCFAQQSIESNKQIVIKNTYLCIGEEHNELASPVLLSKEYYNSFNACLVKIIYKADGNIDAVSIHEYDTLNRLIGYITYNDMGKLIDSMGKKYSSDNTVMPILFNYDWESSCENPKALVKCKYDQLGNIIYYEKWNSKHITIEKYRYDYTYKRNLNDISK